MNFSLHHVTNKDGVRLRYGISPPSRDNLDAYVLILQGRGEYIERYQETAEDLTQRGLGCVTFDFRGQGGSDRATSDPIMGYIKDVTEYVSDTACIMAHIKDQHDITCQMLLTHSTGGLVAMKMLLSQPDLWKSVVMLAPFFGMGGPDWLALAAQFLSASLCRYGFDQQYLPGQKALSPLNAFEPENLLTSDAERYARNVALLTAQPDLVIGGVSAGWLDACFRTQANLMGKLAASADAMSLPPITMVLAGNDQVVSNTTTNDLFGNHPNVTMCEIPEARHEILQEQDYLRDQFWAAFDLHVSRHHAEWLSTAG